jgi:hypothetical protein
MNRLKVSHLIESVATHDFYNQQNPHEFLVLEVAHANFSCLLRKYLDNTGTCIWSISTSVITAEERSTLTSAHFSCERLSILPAR